MKRLRYKRPIYFFALTLALFSTSSLGQSLHSVEEGPKPLYNGSFQAASQTSSIKFNGSIQEAFMGNWFHYKKFSIGIWLKPGVSQVDFANVIDNNHKNYFSWVLEQSYNKINRYVFGHNRDSINAVVLVPDVWQHLMLVSDDENFSIYLNGELVASNNSGPLQYDGTESLRLGAWGPGGRIWNGEIGEVILFDGVMDPEQVRALFHGHLERTRRPLAHYRDYDPSIDVIADVSGNNHAMTLIRTPAHHEASIALLNKDLELKKEQLNHETMLKRILIANLLGLILIGAIVFGYRQRYLKKIKEAELRAKVQLEKDRIATDLHDNIGAQLTAISMGLNRLRKSGSIEPEIIQSLHEDANAAIVELRGTIWGINRTKVTVQELLDKINMLLWRLKLHNENFAYDSEASGVDNNQALQPMQAINIYRIAQEAVSNIIKHSGANRVSMAMTLALQKLTLTIADNGSGFDRGRIDTSDHYGLANMRKRAAEIGAEIEIQSRAGEGTCIRISLPFNGSIK